MLNKTILSTLLYLCVTFSGCKQVDNYDVSKNNVVWDTPSQSSFGSMPLGNGDIGLNVWVEPSGDLLFYISKVNAFDYQHKLPKLGRIRIKSFPKPDVANFKQELCLPTGSVRINMGDIEWNIRVDALTDNVVAELKSKNKYTTEVSLESIRPLHAESEALPSKDTYGIIFDSSNNELAWAYRNISSHWSDRLKAQNSEAFAAKTNDPLLYRTSGGYIKADGFVSKDKHTLVQTNPSDMAQITVKIASSQTETFRDWFAQVSSQPEPDVAKHHEYWSDFWNRSYINVSSCGTGMINMDQCRYTQFDQGSKAYEGYKLIDADANAYKISQMYALERFCEAAASRGEVPPPYNGSIFTMDMPAGTLGFDATKSEPVSPDGRDWAVLSFMWQNTRHPLWSMATRGDYDCLRAGLQFVRDGLDVCKDHCRKIFGHGGAFIMEASWWNNVGVFNWEEVPSHLRYHLLATIETPAIMCEYYEHTEDKQFLHDVLLPCADEFIRFYEEHFPERDVNGFYTQKGVGCAETFQNVTNPCTEIGCLKFLLSKLITFDIDKSRKEHWSKLLSEMPEVPLKTIRGRKLLAVGDVYDPARTNCESPELYSIYPFRQVWLGKDSLLGIARLSHHLRTVSLDGSVDAQGVETGGWQSAPVQAAYLGLAKEAARLVSINFNDQFIHWNDNIRFDIDDPIRNTKEWRKRPRTRFPAFWECKMDGTPDNDHGANSVNTLQSMLLQSDGERIYLLPAFPENWDVSFCLKAAYNTTVECVYKGGKVKTLKVTPEHRKKDIINCASYENRIRTLVQTALSDFNYLYDIPPMLDAQPTGGATSKSWIDKYGYTLESCKAGVFENAVFKGNKVYLHLLNFENEVTLPKIDRKLISYKFVTGNGVVIENSSGLTIKGQPDKLDTIVELVFDASLESLAMDLPSVGSFTKNKNFKQTKDADWTLIEVDLGKKKSIKRFEIGIDNTKHLRGEGVPFILQAKDHNDKWITIYEGSIYGKICGKALAEIKTKDVRLKIKVSDVRQFDLFN